MKRAVGSDDARDVSLLAIDQYNRYVTGTPALTVEEHQQLIARIERGKAEQHQACPDARVVEDGRAARERWIEGMQRLVIFHARLVLYRFRGMELLDLVQEGNLALVRLLDRADLLALEDVGQVAGAVVRADLRRLRSRDGLVRAPGVVEAVRKMQGVQAELCVDLGREPTMGEVAQAMGVVVAKVYEWQQDAERVRVSSLHALQEGEGDEPLEVGFVGLYQQFSAIERARHEALETMVQEAIEAALTGRQREVVVRWYGIDRESESFAKIGGALGIKSAVVGRTAHKAEQKLLACLVVPYGTLRGQPMEYEWYTTDQAAAVLGLTRQQFCWLVAQGKIRRLPEKGEWVARARLARYARCDVEQLAAERQEQSA